MGLAVRYVDQVPPMLKWETTNETLKKVKVVYVQAMNFLCVTLVCLKEGGARTLLVKIPDAIVQISTRIGSASSIPGSVINRVADIVMPLQVLGGSAKNFLSFSDVGTKSLALFSGIKTSIEYVVKGNNGIYYKAQLPLGDWGAWANRAQAFADWSLSITECGSYLWKFSNPDANGSFPLAPLSTWSGRYFSIKGLCFESWFLYKTWYQGSHHNGTVQINNALLARRELTGSLLKLSLAVAGISLDIFRTFAAKGYAPFWMEPAMFWINIANTFVTPVAFTYWPSLVTKPLYAAAG
jgi:hypothetical protein